MADVTLPRSPLSFEAFVDPPAVLHASQHGDLVFGEGEGLAVRRHPGDGPTVECRQFQPDVRGVLEVGGLKGSRQLLPRVGRRISRRSLISAVLLMDCPGEPCHELLVPGSFISGVCGICADWLVRHRLLQRTRSAPESLEPLDLLADCVLRLYRDLFWPGTFKGGGKPKGTVMAVKTLDRTIKSIAPPDDQSMLALAMLSYRAFHELRPGELRLARLRRSILNGLEDVPPIAQRFDLVWGPAAYRAPLTVFDQNVMYVVKERTRPRYVVVVRGTNPLSVVDWIFGDLWAGIDIAWPHAEAGGFPGARVSLSSHLAINILRHMRSSGPRPTATERVWRLIDEQAGEAIRRGARAILRPLGSPIEAGMRKLRMELRSDLRALKTDQALQATGSIEDRVAGMLAAHSSAPVRRIIERIGRRTGLQADVAQRELVRLLEGSFHLRSRLAPGSDLAHFLRAAVEMETGEVEVVVTGHSKGGALSSTLALWLAQTQGTDGVRPVLQWDRDRKAVVSCWSFAGPTAGNADFAALSDNVIGDRCHRVSNRLDMVPHAWQVRPGGRKAEGFFVENIPKMYGSDVHVIKTLGPLSRVVSRDVRSLDYRHVGKNITVLDSEVDPEKTLFTEQVAYQHMEAYLNGLGMGEYADTRTFFSLLV